MLESLLIGMMIGGGVVAAGFVAVVLFITWRDRRTPRDDDAA